MGNNGKWPPLLKISYFADKQMLYTILSLKMSDRYQFIIHVTHCFSLDGHQGLLTPGDQSSVVGANLGGKPLTSEAYRPEESSNPGVMVCSFSPSTGDFYSKYF